MIMNVADMLSVISLSNWSIQMKGLTTLMVSSGLRVSEAISIVPNDVMSTGSILLKSSKGSKDRVVTPVVYLEFWKNYGTFKIPLSDLFNRYFVYREMKKLGLVVLNGFNRNNSVTHSGRKAYIREINSKTKNIDKTAEYIGHKNSSSTKYYINDSE